MEPILKSLGHTLKERRRMLGFSQAKVALLTGKTQPQIARLETGLGEPSFSSVVEVARALGTELVAVPIKLLPTVRSLISSLDWESRGYQTTPDKDGRPRLVGNDPDHAPGRGRAKT